MDTPLCSYDELLQQRNELLSLIKHIMIYGDSHSDIDEGLKKAVGMSFDEVRNDPTIKPVLNDKGWAEE